MEAEMRLMCLQAEGCKTASKPPGSTREASGELSLLAPWPQTCSLQSCEQIHFCYSSTPSPVCDTWPPKLWEMHRETEFLKFILILSSHMWLMATLLDSTVNMSIMPSPIRQGRNGGSEHSCPFWSGRQDAAPRTWQDIGRKTCGRCLSWADGNRELPTSQKWLHSEGVPLYHGQSSLADYSPWGRKESDTTKWLIHTHTQTFHRNWNSSLKLFLKEQRRGGERRGRKGERVWKRGYNSRKTKTQRKKKTPRKKGGEVRWMGRKVAGRTEVF